MDRKKEFNFDTLLGFFSIITAGAICILLLFCGYTQQDEQKALSSAEETLQFLKTSCLRCERYNVEGKRKILTHLRQSEETAKQYLTDEQIRNGDVLTDFCKKQNFTGMVVFDENFNIIGTSKDENHKVLAEVFDEKIFNDVVDHSDKYYMDFVDKNGLKFAYALSDSNGYAYLCYEKLSDEADDGLNLTLDSILDKYQFENEGIVLITQNGNTVYSNDQHMMIVSENEEPVSTIENTKYEENKFSILNIDSEKWYAAYKKYGNYNIYVLFSEKNVFNNRNNHLAVSVIVYIVFVFVALQMHLAMKRRNIMQKQKDIRTIMAIGEIYETILLFRTETLDYEVIKVPKKYRYIFKNRENIMKSFRFFNEKGVSEEYHKIFADFTNMSVLKKSLNEEKYIECLFKDSNDMWMYALLTPQEKDISGRIISAILLIRDADEGKKREIDYQIKLKKTAEQAERANAAKTDFLRRMSHDVRTPINGIMGMAAISNHNLGNAQKQKECNDKIIKSSGFLLELVSGVLDMNKLESGKIVLEKRKFDLKQLLEETAESVEIRAKERGIRFCLENYKCEHKWVFGSPVHVRQILQNIMTNAVMHNKENGSVNVICEEFFSEKNSAVFEFVCADTGKGMSEEFQKHAFESFAQEESTARTSYNGTGLGLPIAKELTEQMGGSINFVSKAGEGTTFTIRLSFELALGFEEEKSEESKKTLLEGKKILLVEDNELNMEIAEFMLENQKGTVVKAWNGQEAVDIYAKSKDGEFDLILMDIMMPIMNGIEASKQIRCFERKDSKTIPIVAMSANTFHDDRQKGIDAGVNAYIPKPVDEEKLVKILRKYI